MVLIGTHIIIIHINVIKDVYMEYFNMSPKFSTKSLLDLYILFAIYPPNGNPSIIFKIGTPIPIATSTVSRII